jgi:tryptophanyl-tRNA synthetase
MLTMKDDEKALFKEKLTFEDTHKFALQNAKDIIACGFDVKKTFIYSDLEYVKGHFLMNVWEFSKLITFNQVRGAFGFNERLVSSFPLVLESHNGRRDTSYFCPLFLFPPIPFFFTLLYQQSAALTSVE